MSWNPRNTFRGEIVNLSNRQRNIIELAKNMSAQSEHKTFHHGAVLVKGSRIINAACNTLDFSSFADRFTGGSYGTRHAELSTILGIPKKTTTGCDVYVVRTKKNGDLASSKPCKMCSSAMRFVGIRRVFYSDENGDIRSWKL